MLIWQKLCSYKGSLQYFNTYFSSKDRHNIFNNVILKLGHVDIVRYLFRVFGITIKILPKSTYFRTK